MRRYKTLFLLGLMSILTIFFVGCDKGDPYEKVNFDDILKLGEYKNLEYPKIENEITDSNVDEYIKSELEKNAQNEKITDSSVVIEKGDAINIKFVGKIDGKEFEGGKSDNFDMVLGQTPMIEGFSEGIVGHKIGETFNLNLKFPKGYHAKNLAGKPVTFEITINSKNKKVTPELTDKWVADNTKSKGVNEYKASVKDELTKKAEKYQKFQTKGMLLRKIVENTKFKKIPEDLLKAEVEKSKKILDKVILSKQKIKFEDYAKTIYAQDKSVKNPTEKLEKQLKQEAENVTKKKLVVYAIAKKEGIKVNDKEVEDKFVQSIKELKMNVKDFEKQYNISRKDAKELFGYRSIVFEKKVGDKILSLGKEK